MLSATTYFCDAYASWQKGGIENANGRIRLTSLKVHSMETDNEDRTCNDRGECVRLADRKRASFYSVDHIRLNHYYARSQEELVEKAGRGHFVKAMQPRYPNKIRRTIANIERAVVEDRAALDYLKRIGEG